MALIINIDSSLEIASVSISKDGIILKHLLNDIQKQHASFIHTAVQQITNELQISLNEVNAIGCTIGPGSYTGLRVGLAAAKGFCYALNIPLITVGTLEAMAHTIQAQQPDNNFLFCPMIDARRMEVYTALYNQSLEELIPAHAIVITKQFFEKEMQHSKILFFGNGMEKFRNLAKNEQANFTTIDSIYYSINVLTQKKFTENILTPLAAAAPLYAKEFYNG